MDRRDFLRGLSGGFAARALFGQDAPKPNIIVILSDDHGYAEMGVQGNTDIPTPHMDSLARGGVRFTNGYVSCPVCSPTRAGLMTGRYQNRFGHEFNPGPAEEADEKFGLPLTETTLAHRLKSLGYATGMVGKWHLGYKPELHPQKRGFDDFFGFLGGAHSYLPGEDRRGPILRGTETVHEKEYLTDAFAREAVAFVEKHRTRPFFLYLAFNAVHNPLESTEKYLARFASIQDQRRRTFAAMLSAMDDAIGRLLGKLREAGIEQNTLIFFLGDNGGPTPNTTSRNDPLRGYKGQVLEGGIRVPFLAQWKGRLPAGLVYHEPVIALDILPTAVAAAGGTNPASAALDGVNLLPHLTGKVKRPPHEALFWRFGAQAAVRKGDWKLVRLQNQSWQLYNLAQDISESKDLAAGRPDKLKELEAAFEAWNRQMAAPRWGAGRQQRATKRKKK